MSSISSWLYQQRWKNNQFFLNITHVRQMVDEFILLIFPQRGDEKNLTLTELNKKLDLLEVKLLSFLTSLQSLDSKLDAKNCIKLFLDQIQEITRQLDLDAKAAFEGDPAAYSLEEVIITYPGFYAVCVYRLAHALYLLEVPLLPRLMSEYAHEKTGIDIHPGARIGDSFFIDHGTGVVIGETTHIGKNVKIYQGVTLGALSVKKRHQLKKRHPTIESNVVIYANSTILGGQTVVGENSVIGGNVWITQSVPKESRVFNGLESKEN